MDSGRVSLAGGGRADRKHMASRSKGWEEERERKTEGICGTKLELD